MSATTKMALALLCNIIIVLATFFVVRSYFKTEDGKYKWAQGAWKFKFFTTDSNVVAAVAALIVIPFEVLALVRGESLTLLPLVIKYIGTVVVMLTFLTVLFFLGPTQGYIEMFSGTSFYMHFMGAALAFVSFCFLEEGKLGILWIFPALLPMISYAILYRHMVLDKGPLYGGWEDFYGFNVHDRWKKSAVIMHLAMLLINIIVIVLHNKYAG